jgi:SAM-dependent methyltransferase
MSSLDSMPAAHANLYTLGASAWDIHEIDRLKSMDDLLAAVTQGDLNPILNSVLSEKVGGAVSILDIGAGSGNTVENLCEEAGGVYYALDANGELLASRATDPSRKIHSTAESIPADDGAFDITFSRAVTAWTPEPRAAIAEQLRVTGRVAVFTEFDWTGAAMALGSDALAEGMAAKAAMMLALTKGGFKPDYGTRLGADIDHVATSAGIEYTREERILDLPPGDHRQIFLDAARGISAYLRATKAGAAVTMATFLDGYVRDIEGAETVRMTLPTIVTQIVTKT